MGNVPQGLTSPITLKLATTAAEKEKGGYGKASWKGMGNEISPYGGGKGQSDPNDMMAMMQSMMASMAGKGQGKGKFPGVESMMGMMQGKGKGEGLGKGKVKGDREKLLEFPAEQKVWLGSLPPTADSQALQAHLSQAGAVQL